MASRNRPPSHDGSRTGNPENADAPSDGGRSSRRGVRTAVLSAVGLLSLVAIAVGVLLTSLGPPEGTGPDRTPGMGTTGGGSGTTPPGGDGPAITGTITVAPELAGRVGAAHVLFIIARRGPGPPFAVKRVPDPRFPLRYRMGQENVMMAGTPFEGEVSLIARLSLAGGAGPAQPGDLEGEHPGRVAVGQGGVDILINHVH